MQMTDPSKKTGLPPTAMVFMVVGLLLLIYAGDRVFPTLARSLDPILFDAIKGGAGAALGFVAYWIYRRIKGEPPGEDF